jgi:sporulation protein YabP
MKPVEQQPQQKPQTPQKPHSVYLENCQKGVLTGVSKVVSSNDTMLVLETGAGGMTVSGSGLKINKFDVNEGSLSFEGTVGSIRYSAAKLPFLKRIFR